MDQPSLYDEDVYAWSELQARALRRLAQTASNLPNELDLPHVIEEIEDVGRSELNGAKSRIRLIFAHLIKLRCASQSPSRNHWRSEIRGWHQELRDRLTPSMHQKIDLGDLWRAALSQAHEDLKDYGEVDGGLADRLGACPFTIDSLAGQDFDIDQALTALESRDAN